MATWVALLRSVNLGRYGKVDMKDLAEVMRAAGFSDVTTYIQSGNVVFTSDRPVTGADVEHAIEHGLGTTVTVMLRSATAMRKVVRANPFGDADSRTLHVGFFVEKPATGTVKALDLARFAPEQAAVKGTEVYLHLPNGMGRSKLPESLNRQIKVPMTVRNWNTVTKLVELTR